MSSTGAPPVSTNRPAVDLTALTHRDDFLLEVGEALGGQASVRPVDSIAAALEFLTSTKRAQVLAIDTRDLTDVRGDVELAHAQAAHAVILVFAAADTEKQIGAALKGSNVFAVLPLPIDKRKTSALLEGAITEAVAKRAARPNSTAAGMTVESFQPRADAGSTRPTDGTPGKKAVWIGAGIAVVALAAGGYWFLNKGKAAPAAPLAATPKAVAAFPTSVNSPAADDASLDPKPAVDTTIVNGKVDELLEKARLAMRERRYTEPAGDNALLYYRSAIAADGTSGEAKDGLQRVAAVVSSRFDEAMSTGKYDEASLALANLKIAGPNDPRIGALELKLATAQISKAFADGNIDRAAALVRQAQQSASIPADQLAKWRSEITRRQEDAKVQRLANLVSDRIRDGKLTDPADDDAKAYVQQLHDLAPSNATTQRAIRDLNAAYLRKAREASNAKNSADVDHWIAEARAGGVSANELNSVQRDMAAVRQKAAQAESDHLAQVARDHIHDGRLTDPPQDSAAYYLTQLQASDPTNAALAPASRELAGKLLERAKAAALAGKTALVEPDLTQARHWGADPKDIQAIQQVQATAKAPAQSPSRTPTAAAAGLTPAQLAATLKRVRYAPPEFPEKAISQRINGSVTIEYIVTTTGDTRDVRVIDATPPGVFDKAAITAVKRWHYDPVVANGVPVEVPVRTSIRFELPQ